MQDVILASDHRGFALKKVIKDLLKERKFFFVDCGVESDARPNDNDQIPPIIKVVREAVECVANAKNMCGILICGSGIATSIIANRHRGIRAALCNSVEIAREARGHNDANVLCLGADNADAELVKKIVLAFLNTRAIEETRYRRRQELFDKI
jgi:RpiB/LacA/LacB family sugar-phosphate isomerase